MIILCKNNNKNESSGIFSTIKNFFISQNQNSEIGAILTENQYKLFYLMLHKSDQKKKYDDCLQNLYEKIVEFNKNPYTSSMLENALEKNINEFVGILHNMYNIEDFSEILSLITQIKDPCVIKYIFSIWRYINIIFSSTSDVWQRSLNTIHLYLLSMDFDNLSFIKLENISNLAQNAKNTDKYEDIQLIQLKVLLKLNINIFQKLETILSCLYDSNMTENNKKFLINIYRKIKNQLTPEKIII